MAFDPRDGVDDGRELAGCRDPSSGAVTPWVGPEPRLVALGEDCTEFRWTYPGGGRTAGLLRGQMSAASMLPAMIDLAGELGALPLQVIPEYRRLKLISCLRILDSRLRAALEGLNSGQARESAVPRPMARSGAAARVR